MLFILFIHFQDFPQVGFAFLLYLVKLFLKLAETLLKAINYALRLNSWRMLVFRFSWLISFGMQFKCQRKLENAVNQTR